nr:hypothetical protein [Ardenticatenales bacterium]
MRAFVLIIAFLSVLSLAACSVPPTATSMPMATSTTGSQAHPNILSAITLITQTPPGRARLLPMTPTPTITNIPAPTFTPIPLIVVEADVVNVRSGPDLTYP